MTANAVDNRGIVVGDYDEYCSTGCAAPGLSSSGSGQHAWMYEQGSGSLSELTYDPSELGASAYGINNDGTIAGEATLANGPEPVLWKVTGGAMLIGDGSTSYDWAVAVNDGGTVLGQYEDSGSPGSGAFLWTPPGYTETVLPDLECDYCARLYITANAINNSGTAVGRTLSVIYNTNGVLVSGGMFAVEWQDGTVKSLGGLQSSTSSEAYGINNGGDIVGASTVGAAQGAPSHAFLYSHGVMTDLGTVPGDVDSAAYSINDRGQIVGYSVDAAGSGRAFLYDKGAMYDLNALIDPTDPLAGFVTLEEAVSISQNGYIAVNGADSRDSGANAGTWRAFVLVPSH
jgi:probable HAF family extracellular repeat protein